MMSVEEYAQDIKKTVAEVLAKCSELNIKIVDEEEDFLTQDDIIMLDNAFSLVDPIQEEEESVVVLEALEDEAEEEKAVVKKKKNVKKEKKVKLDKSNYKKLEKLQAHTIEVEQTLETVIHYNDGMTVGEFAKKINVPAVKIIKQLFDLGKMIGINNVLDYDTALELATEQGFELDNEVKALEHNFEKFEVVDNETDLEYRSPVITIMGHVDHGKTTLLDTIRNANVDVTASEFGGITQHIGAYQIDYLGKKITFLDTPGHAAFSQMRARGAGVTDIVIIVVAADDGVMPQTVEAIDHAKAAKVPIIVAVNKIDRPDANIERVMTELSNYGLMPEEWGGETIYVPISAKMNQNIDGLLETITLIAEVEEFKANPKRYALGTVIESHLDKGRGAVATLLIQNGTLRLGDPIVVGSTYGRVRKMVTANGEEILIAPPSTPVEIIGLNAVPEAGDNFMAFETEKEARQVGEKRAAQSSVINRNSSSAISLEDLFSHIEAGQTKEINIMIKTDVQGIAEAIKSSLEKIEVDGVRVKIIRATAGAITESDIMLASAGNAIIIGFNVRPDAVVRAAAVREKVDVRLYNVIYNILSDVENAMRGMLDPEFEEEVLGRAEVRQTFKVTKFGIIAGSYVTEGRILSDASVRVIREGITIYDGAIDNLKRFKDDVKEVKTGFECGITIEKFSDIKENDIFEAYRMVEIKRK